MRTYTTHILTGYQADELISFHDSTIGTEYDIDETEKGVFVITFFELEANEVQKLRRAEAKLLNAYEGV